MQSRYSMQTQIIFIKYDINEEDNRKLQNAIKEVCKGECIIMEDFNTLKFKNAIKEVSKGEWEILTTDTYTYCKHP